MSEANNELDILFPQRQITAGGQTLTLREYSFKESLQLHGKFQPLISALSALIDGERMPDLERIIAALAQNTDCLIELSAISAGCEPAFIESLPPHEGQRLLLLWWELNAPFLIASAALYLQAGAAAKASLSPGEPPLPA